MGEGDERKDGVRLQHRKGRKEWTPRHGSNLAFLQSKTAGKKIQLFFFFFLFFSPELTLTLRLCLRPPLPPWPSPCLKIHTSILYSEKAHRHVHTRVRPVWKVFGPTTRGASCMVQSWSETNVGHLDLFLSLFEPWPLSLPPSSAPSTDKKGGAGGGSGWLGAPHLRH